MPLFFMKFLVVLGSALGATTGTAYFADGSNTVSGETVLNAKKILACTLVKASFKGGTTGFFTQSENKSVEAYCHNRSGEPTEFSAHEDQLEQLNTYAGQDVLVYFSAQVTVENAKTNLFLLDIKPVVQTPFHLEKLCGPSTGKHLYADEETWSRGYRVAQAYFAQWAEDGWQLTLLEGKQSSKEWGKESLVQLSRFCNAEVYKLMEIDEPLLYRYVQQKENGTYFIESISRILATPLPSK